MTTLIRKLCCFDLAYSRNFRERSTVPGIDHSWMTVGVKLIAAVTVISTVCMGMLFYANHRSNRSVEHKVEELLAIHELLGRNLRETVFTLQKKYLSLPDFFTVHSNEEIAAYLENTFQVTDNTLFEERDKYVHYYSRAERRELAQGAFVMQKRSDALVVSLGYLDGKNNFSGTIQRITLRSDAPDQDLPLILAAITQIQRRNNSQDAFRDKLNELSGLLADEALQAEETRNAILYQVERISAEKGALDAARAQRERATVLISLLTLTLNLLVLFFMTRTIVEKPLLKLTSIINEIRAGRFPEVPFAERRDQIGVLSGALNTFKKALLDLRAEEDRKMKEKEAEEQRRAGEEKIIDGLLANSTLVIHKLESKARELVTLADSQEDLATLTKEQSLRVVASINTTAENTTTVLDSTREQKTLVADIQRKVNDQNEIVQHIIRNTHDSRNSIQRLSQATNDINTIVEIVRTIADQTKLLALNATIEAARAGEQGKGFGVVAAEVKMLSQQTARATGDIMVKIKAIGEAGKSMISSMQQIEHNVARMNDAGSHILEAVAQQENAAAKISQRAKFTSEHIMDVSGSITEVTQAATQTLDLSTQVRNHSEDIAEDVSQLLSHTREKLNLLAR